MSERWRRKIVSGERWSEADGRAALAAWEASGELLTAFARRSGIQAQRPAWWRDRLASPSSSALVPMTVVTTGSRPVSIQIGEVRIEAEDVSAVSPAWLAAVVVALREAGACC